MVPETTKMLFSQSAENTPIRFGSPHVSKDRLFILVFVLIGFSIRLFLIPSDSVLNGDGIYYTTLGEKFVSGDFDAGISAYWSPLYSIITGIASLFFQDKDLAGRSVSLVAGSLTIIPSFLLIRNFFGHRSAYLGTVLVVFHPFLIKSSTWAMTESLYTLVFTTMVLSGWHALTTGNSRTFLVTGMLLGVAYLIKPEAIGFLALYSFIAFVASFYRERNSLAISWVSIFLLFVGFSICFVPYFLYLHQKTGQWTLSQKITVNLPVADYDGDFLALSDSRQTTMKDRIWGDDYKTEFNSKIEPAINDRGQSGQRPLGEVVSILTSKAQTLLRKQIRDYFPSLLPVPFIILVFAGLFCRPVSKDLAAKDAYLLTFVICTLIGYAASAVELRYLFPIVPLLMAWTARGIVAFGEWCSRSVAEVFGGTRRISSSIVAVCTLSVLLVSSIPLQTRVLQADDINNVPFEEKRAGLWIRNRSESKKPMVMSSNITVAYYAEGNHIYLPDENLPTILEYARQRGTTYLVFSERRTRDANVFSANSEQLNELRLVYSEVENEPHRVLVYELIY